jgi:Ca2+-binding EF-hand superfamily protein
MFEAKFRAKMAKAAPADVLVAKQMKDCLTNDEVEEYRETFKKFYSDNGGSIDSKELGKLVRVLRFEDYFVVSIIDFNISG